MNELTVRLRRWLWTLRYTPFHPQWFAYLQERRRLRWAAKVARGAILDVGSAEERIEPMLPTGCDYFALDYPGSAYAARPDVFGHAQHLPFRDGSFDTVLLMEVLEHLPDPGAALKEVGRVLRPAGRVVLSAPFLYPIHDAPGDFRRWTVHGLEQLSTDAGFSFERPALRGSPLQTGALLFNLGLAWQATHVGGWRKAPMIALTAAIVPAVNLVAWLLAAVAGSVDRHPMPSGYNWVLRKRTL